MAFRIEVARHAEIDIAVAVNYIAEDSPIQAARWFEGLFRTLETLREFPFRNPLIQEAADLGRDLRCIHHYSHRVIYEVQDAKNTVYIARVYHGARKPLSKRTPIIIQGVFQILFPATGTSSRATIRPNASS